MARYIRLEQEPDIAEFAISVADEYQGRGAGSILLDLLIKQAKTNNICTLRGYVLASNRAMTRLLERHDAERSVEQDGSLRFDLHINS